MFSFRDKVVWITGASSGIGAAVARLLARKGAIVVLSARREEKLQEVARSISATGAQAHIYPVDLADREAVLDISVRIATEVGPIDVLLANAGTHIPSDVKQFDSAQYAKICEINYLGSLYAIDGVLPGMIARKSGYIVGVASIAGLRGLPLSGAYCASKAALIAFFESLDFDLLDTGVKVSIVAPGFVKTPLTDLNTFPMPFLMDVDKAASAMVSGMERQKRFIHFPKRFTSILLFLRLIPFALYSFLIKKTVMK